MSKFLKLIKCYLHSYAWIRAVIKKEFPISVGLTDTRPANWSEKCIQRPVAPNIPKWSATKHVSVREG